MAKCYICGCELDSRKTKPEHIIPNGIGGKLKSRCKVTPSLRKSDRGV